MANHKKRYKQTALGDTTILTAALKKIMVEFAKRGVADMTIIDGQPALYSGGDNEKIAYMLLSRSEYWPDSLTTREKNVVTLYRHRAIKAGNINP